MIRCWFQFDFDFVLTVSPLVLSFRVYELQVFWFFVARGLRVFRREDTYLGASTLRTRLRISTTPVESRLRAIWGMQAQSLDVLAATPFLFWESTVSRLSSREHCMVETSGFSWWSWPRWLRFLQERCFPTRDMKIRRLSEPLLWLGFVPLDEETWLYTAKWNQSLRVKSFISW